MSEALEVIGDLAEGPVDCTLSYNELMLAMTFAYQGRPVIIPSRMPPIDDLADTTDGVLHMGGWIIRKLSDYSSVSSSGGRQKLQMAFEC